MKYLVASAAASPARCALLATIGYTVANFVTLCRLALSGRLLASAVFRSGLLAAGRLTSLFACCRAVCGILCRHARLSSDIHTTLV